MTPPGPGVPDSPGAPDSPDAVPVSLPAKPHRTWKWPRRLGRFRTSTVILVVAFVGTALLRGYFMNPEQNEEKQTGVNPVETSQTPQPRSEATTPPTSSAPATTTPAPSSSTTDPGAAGTTATPTTSPLIVLPPGLVPSGVELPPGVAVETTTEATPTPATTTP